MNRREVIKAAEHAEWVLGTLVPDMRESGRNATADDLEQLAKNVLKFASMYWADLDNQSRRGAY